MKLFHWNRSEALKLCGHGDVIVAAPDVATARETALHCAETAELGYSNMQILHVRILSTLGGFVREDARDEFHGKLALLRADLEKEPIVYDAPFALFINGSE